jgi:hypothetical protein
MQVESSDNSPAHSDQVSLEVALLKSSALDESPARVTMVVASDADVRAYVSDSLLPGSLEVIAVGSIAAALDEATRCSPRLLVVSHDERGVVRHFPAVPAVMLSDDAPAAQAMESRLAPLVILRGAIGSQRLLEVATSLLAWDRENVSHVATAITHVASLKEAT